MPIFKDPGVTTPYSTVTPLIADEPIWAPPLDRERVAAYAKYDDIYWNQPDTFKLVQRGMEEAPIYLPNPRTIVDTTSHFLLKGLQITAEGDMGASLQSFMERELFLSGFQIAKQSGVTRGDFVLHMTADPGKPEGLRISVNSVDPSMYFPEYDDDDLEKVLAVDLVEQIMDTENPTSTKIHRLRYEYDEVDGERRVFAFEAVYEPMDWWNKDRAKLLRVIRERTPLPSRIRTIPVYHFQNLGWQGQPFGSSELRGFERVQAAVNQTISDEELALSLEGLGVYATDAAQPVDKDGNDVDWVIGPGKVIEIPQQGQFVRVQGVGSVRPFKDHMEMLWNTMYEASATFRVGTIDAQVAESGIALALKFLPTAAKLEFRDEAGLGKLRQFWFDWKAWMFEYEGKNFGEAMPTIALGSKLPQNRNSVLNELNNMLDRNVVSKEWYRDQVEKLLGYTFPDGLEEQILKELEKEAEARAKGLLAAPSHQDGRTTFGDGNRSNNARRPNESDGSESDPSLG